MYNFLGLILNVVKYLTILLIFETGKIAYLLSYNGVVHYLGLVVIVSTLDIVTFKFYTSYMEVTLEKLEKELDEKFSKLK